VLSALHAAGKAAWVSVRIKELKFQQIKLHVDPIVQNYAVINNYS
ncbi:uncharacterized protein METZ01_LOCUS403015, partial [marine metagenome]